MTIRKISAVLARTRFVCACAMGALITSSPAFADIIYKLGNQQYYNVNIAADTNAASVIGDIGNTGFQMTFDSMLGPYGTAFSGLPINMHCQHGVAFCESYADSLVSTAAHTGFSSITLSALGGTFWTAGDFALDLLGATDTTVTFTAYDNGVQVGLPTALAFDATGQNQYNFQLINNEMIDELVITSTADFNIADIKQVSLQPFGAPPFQVPEPPTLAFVGTGLLGLGFVAKKRRRRESGV